MLKKIRPGSSWMKDMKNMLIPQMKELVWYKYGKWFSNNKQKEIAQNKQIIHWKNEEKYIREAEFNEFAEFMKKLPEKMMWTRWEKCPKEGLWR
jgi:hypothetical protein